MTHSAYIARLSVPSPHPAPSDVHFLEAFGFSEQKLIRTKVAMGLVIQHMNPHIARLFLRPAAWRHSRSAALQWEPPRDAERTSSRRTFLQRFVSTSVTSSHQTKPLSSPAQWTRNKNLFLYIFIQCSMSISYFPYSIVKWYTILSWNT